MYEMPHKSEMCLRLFRVRVCVCSFGFGTPRLSPYCHMTRIGVYSAWSKTRQTETPHSDEYRSNAVMFTRFLRPVQPSSRRAYSLFSKPPGGRFFNSSKPPKVVPGGANANSAKSPTRVEASTPNNNNNNDPQQSAPDDTSTPPSPVPSATPALTTTTCSAPTVLASHPPLSAPDLRLHQFFSQHRPLVLAQPASALFDASSTLVLGTHTQAPPLPSTSTAPATLDNPPETTPEADADTARLLARTLAMNAVNSSVSWDATLRRLGLNPAEGRDAAENAALEGLAVRLDSTHRKRRKKMKKHKCVSLFLHHVLFYLALIITCPLL